MMAFRKRTLLRHNDKFLRCMVWIVCLLCLPVPALAETIVWNGPGNPANTGKLKSDPWGGGAPGYLYPDAPSNNTVSVNGDVPESVFGGVDGTPSGNAPAAADGNAVSVNSGTVGDIIVGGGAISAGGNASATGNSVVISGGTADDATGGNALSTSGAASAANNRVSVNGGTVGGVTGGYAKSGSGPAAATDNTLNVTGGAVGLNVTGGYAGSDSGPVVATGNKLSVTGGVVGQSVFGGYAESDSGAAEASDNSVSISGGTVGQSVYGGSARSGSGPATATGNSVSVTGGTVNLDVTGGYAESDSGAATTTGNNVVINGGTVNGGIFGGSAFSDTGPATATGNTVALSGAPVFANGDIWGGNALGAAPSGDSFTGNTLNVWNYTGSAVNSVQNFQYFNFILPASLQPGDAALSVAGAAYFDDTLSGAGAGAASTITGVDIMGGGTPPQTGDSVILMRYGSLGNGPAANGNGVVQGTKGMSLLYDWQLVQTGSELTATVTSVRAHPRAKAFAEGRAAALAFINQGGDLASGPGMDAARSAGSGFAAFSAFQGGTSRYDTGSHIDLDGFSLITGLAWNNLTDYGKLLLGAFFEAGWGNYDSRNSFSNFASVKGEGDTEYYGGGILGRFDFNDAGPGNVYAEASLRAGWSETDFSSSDLRDPLGQKADYDSGSAYYGAHLGLGYLWSINGASSLDLYTKYLWTRQDSDSASVTGDPVQFNSADSHRWRGGARLSHSLTTEGGHTFTPYAGAAYEHEFDGKAKAAAYGYSIDAPDLKGGTGIGELGLTFRPEEADGKAGAFSTDLSVQGYTGVREGVSGSLQLKWEF